MRCAEVRRVGQLEVGDAGAQVGSAQGLHAVQRDPHGAVADGVEVDREARVIERLDERVERLGRKVQRTAVAAPHVRLEQGGVGLDHAVDEYLGGVGPEPAPVSALARLDQRGDLLRPSRFGRQGGQDPQRQFAAGVEILVGLQDAGRGIGLEDGGNPQLGSQPQPDPQSVRVRLPADRGAAVGRQIDRRLAQGAGGLPAASRSMRPLGGSGCPS